MIDHPVLRICARAGIRLGLTRLRRLLRDLGCPQDGFPSVHVAGTNGKGSVSTMVAEVLRQQGYKTGLYTSPHMQRVNERIRIGSAEITDKTLGNLLDELADAACAMGRELEDMGDEGTPLTYFEIMTAVAFLHFKRSKVDVAVIEVGMGGRLDATNVIDPEVCAITSIGLDHTQYLGPDIACIAGEKAGILKPNRPVVVGAVPMDAMRVIRAIAGERGSPVYGLGEEFSVIGDRADFIWRGPTGVHTDMSVGMAGAHQLYNAAVAITVLDLLPLSLACDRSNVRAGIASACINGRLEWVAPDVVIDGAHNPEAAQTLAAYLRTRPQKRQRTLLLGMSADKDVRSFGAILAPQVDRILTTACSHPRALPPGQVAAALEGLSVPVMPAGHVEEALPLARSMGGEVVVAGSIFLAGAVRDMYGLR